MRLKSVIWVKAYIRRCQFAGAAAFVVRHGDDDAGAIFIKVSRLNGEAVLYGPAPMTLLGETGEHKWSVHLAPAGDRAEAEIDAHLARQYSYDRDIWVIEVEDVGGNHYLDDALIAERS
ncbi:MAG: hypothetical protein RLZ98_2071 [Pseudomonadota bacterium]|jgi:hypothetical protein